MRILIIGAGSIGAELIKECHRSHNIREFFILDNHPEAAKKISRGMDKARIVEDFEEPFPDVDLVIEAASQEAVALYGKRTLSNGADLMLMSVGALVDDELREDLYRTAREKERRIYIPPGALCGLDAVISASVVNVDKVTLETRKSPKSLSDSVYVKESGMDLGSLEEETTIFEGPASRAIALFPKNINVASALSLAGVGFEKTMVKIICDPDCKSNTHTIKLKGDSGELIGISMNVPFPENPRTSYLAALSAVSALRNICGNVWYGV